jgi:hypothetical protein
MACERGTPKRSPAHLADTPPRAVQPLDTLGLAADSTEYRALVARIAGGDHDADFTRLRALYARFPDDPFRTPSPDSFFAHARRASNHAAARAAIDSVLADRFADARAHEFAERILRERGDGAAAAREATIVRQLVASIERGSGSTKKPRLPVFSIGEERTVMRAHHVEWTQQSVSVHGDSIFDFVTGVEEGTGRKVSYSFLLINRPLRGVP